MVEENKSKSKNCYLWTEKYRSGTVKQMILPASMKSMVTKWVNSSEIPNIMLYSASPGSGKTTFAKAVLNDVGYDYLYINTSSENGIDVLRSKIESFASCMSFDGRPKAVILDEFDGASEALQRALRAFIEEFHDRDWETSIPFSDDVLM